MRRLELEQARSNLDLVSDMTAFELDDAQLRLQRQRLVVSDVERRVERTPVSARPSTACWRQWRSTTTTRWSPARPWSESSTSASWSLRCRCPRPSPTISRPASAPPWRWTATTYRGELVRISPEVRSGQVRGPGGVPRGHAAGPAPEPASGDARDPRRARRHAARAPRPVLRVPGRTWRLRGGGRHGRPPRSRSSAPPASPNSRSSTASRRATRSCSRTSAGSRAQKRFSFAN